MENAGFQISENLLKLSELFPDIPLNHISQILKTSNDHFDSSVEQLLNYDYIKDDLIDTDAFSGKEDPKNWVLLNNNNNNNNNNNTELGKDNNKQDFSIPSSSNYSSISGSGRTAFSTISSSDDIDTSSSSLSNVIECIKVKEWVTKLEFQDEMMQLLYIDEKDRDLVDWYLLQNSYDKLETIYDIMLNFNPSLSKSKQTREKINSVKLDLLKLQLNSGNIYSDNNVPMSQLIRNNKQNFKSSKLNDFWHEFDSLIKSNPQLNLPEHFYIIALCWFHKDLDKLLTLAFQINDLFPKNKGKYTFERNYKQETLGIHGLTLNDDRNDIKTNHFLSTDKSKDTKYVDDNNDNDNKFEKLQNSSSSSSSSSLLALQTRANTLKSIRSTIKGNELKSYYSKSISETKDNIRKVHEASQLQEVAKKINIAKRAWKIDFHNLTVQNAIYALEIVIGYWWDTEMCERNVHNTKFEITNAVHVEPFVIVTGRGLHSGGGIPKIKNSVLRYLSENNFKYEENMSIVTVLGKRKR